MISTEIFIVYENKLMLEKFVSKVRKRARGEEDKGVPVNKGA